MRVGAAACMVLPPALGGRNKLSSRALCDVLNRKNIVSVSRHAARREASNAQLGGESEAGTQ